MTRTLMIRERREIVVRGIVQGVGFRPFIYSLAQQHRLAGLVCNNAAGVHIEVEGNPATLDQFLRDIRYKAPPLAVIEEIRWKAATALNERDFRIEESRQGADTRALVSPDVATCAECLSEILDVSNRRYRYPFTNCTNCGPRFTITYTVPYDRARTTMGSFAMCDACRREYDDPSDRRFHAQPNACPECGPRVRLVDRAGMDVIADFGDPLQRTAALLQDGAVIAIKGLGGYHLACDPFNPGAVAALRSRKMRQDKPFALMARDLEQVRALCYVDPDEAALLASPARPIVLLCLRESTGVAEDVAPRQQALGVMLAYTPLHHLLLHDAGIPLVMTSGNRSDEPIAFRDADALKQLESIADYFLVHDRPIHIRCDDSVVRMASANVYPIRRSRGYAPMPLRLNRSFSRHTLACGGELKSTFCLARGDHAFLSHHIGDLENYETIQSFRKGIDHYCRLFDVQPELVACDLHPEYFATKYARELEEEGLVAIGVQHHHAHIASCLADNGRPASDRVIGVALDGTGYGCDGTLWGGEFLEGSVEQGFSRRGHLEYACLPGGEAAIRQPWRSMVAQVLALYGEGELPRLPLALLARIGEDRIRHISQLVHAQINTPRTSSAGRLFDAVAALLGVPGTLQTTYEGQAAVELELASDGPTERAYPVVLREEGDGWVVETRPVIAGVVDDLGQGMPPGAIGSSFHRTMAEVIVAGCERIRRSDGAGAVALSGGTFQNMLLLQQATSLLADRGFIVYLHRRVPANDGGLALGQAVLADAMVRQRNG